ncbi:MAG TPA: transcriptional regulator, partial [Psychrobacter sp.]|nr:transcriptional regulator [Psychrobacter sp.]
NRVRIFDLLQQGVTQRAISQQLGVGIATVSRGAKALQRHEDDAINKLLQVHRR